jgi:ribosomal protein S18 acetylase RimI-like enzyme
MDVEKLRERDLDAFTREVQGRAGVPTGLNRSYLWEAAASRGTLNIWHSQGFENVFYGYALRRGWVVEEWIRGKDFEAAVHALVGRLKGDVAFGFSDRLGDDLGWKYNGQPTEWRAGTGDFKTAETDYKFEHRNAVVDLMSQEWWTREQAADFVDTVTGNPKGFSKLAVRENRVLAFAHCAYEAERGWIDAVYVDAESRGRGLGTSVSKAAITKLYRLGAREAFLGVEAGNTGAAGLYSRLGFVPTGWQRNEYEVVR